MKSTVKIPQDKRHRHIITLPIEIWEGEGLKEGDLIEIDVKKIEKSKAMA
jgi:bifunctional DNA-binding transcriptional regulator/antitoxin component of YhaV-PrlF toxin-antitoxin module